MKLVTSEQFNLRHYVIMLIHAFAILIIYVVSKNSIYVIYYKYFSDSVQVAKA